MRAPEEKTPVGEEWVGYIYVAKQRNKREDSITVILNRTQLKFKLTFCKASSRTLNIPLLSLILFTFPGNISMLCKPSTFEENNVTTEGGRVGVRKEGREGG